MLTFVAIKGNYQTHGGNFITSLIVFKFNVRLPQWGG